MTLRFDVRALMIKKIQNQKKILLIEHHDPEIGTHYTLPGGKVEDRESAYEALHRELKEEVGGKIQIGELAFGYEYLPWIEGDELGDRKRVGLVFHARLMTPIQKLKTVRGDGDQVGFTWMSLREVQKKNILLLPRMKKELKAALEGYVSFRMGKN